MATETETRVGRCQSHGEVTGSRELPRTHFPFVVYAVRRFLAKRRPFRCPTCDQPIQI